MASNANETIDLKAYLQRIGLQSPVKPDLHALREIIAAHTAAIAFENLDAFLGVPVSLELPAIQDKLLHQGRGGWCFEQNRLLGAALRAVGFGVTDLAARVLWGRPDDAITARSHMLLRVDIEGQDWLADVGFGGPTPTGPLRLESNTAQITPHERYRLVHPDDGDWRMQLHTGDAWRTLYRFDLQPQYPIDYRASNYWLSTRPESNFVTELIAARAPAGRRLALRDAEFTRRETNGVAVRHALRSIEEFRRVLEQEFLIRLPAHRDFDKRLATLLR